MEALFAEAMIWWCWHVTLCRWNGIIPGKQHQYRDPYVSSSIVNTMAADDLAILVARPSVAMVLTKLSVDIPVSASESLNPPVSAKPSWTDPCWLSVVIYYCHSLHHMTAMFYDEEWWCSTIQCFQEPTINLFHDLWLHSATLSMPRLFHSLLTYPISHW